MGCDITVSVTGGQGEVAPETYVAHEEGRGRVWRRRQVSYVLPLLGSPPETPASKTVVGL